MSSNDFFANATNIVRQIDPNATNGTICISEDLDGLPFIGCVVFTSTDGIDVFHYRVHNSLTGLEFRVEVFKLNMVNMFVAPHAVHTLTLA